MTPSVRGLIPLPNALLAAALLLPLTSCQTSDPEPVADSEQTEEASDGEQALRRATAADFADTSATSMVVADGLKLDLWAPRPLLGSPVAVTLDDEGTAYAVQTRRRKSSNLDIRRHQDWMTEDLGLTSIEEKRAFLHRELDPERSDSNAWQADLNGDGLRDWRDLTVESEVVWRIRDTDGDGRADASDVFAEGFRGDVTGVAAGVLAHDGDVYLTVAPDLWRLHDTDGDGVADERESISHGYGVHIGYAGHDLSGLTLGPDGRIYWSIGDIGVDVTAPDGRHWAYPHQGAVMRADPDGSQFEVFAAGLRNPQELAFDDYGNLISVDNDGDHAGERERYVHLVEGSDSGWRIHWQYGKYSKAETHNAYKVWMDEQLHLPHFEGQAAYITPAIGLAYDGPAGLAYNPGTALGPMWNETFFVSYFRGSPAQSRIHAFRLAPAGSSFRVTAEQEVLSGMQAVGMSFGPGGALYIADWLDGWEKKAEGRIWTLDVPPSQASPLRDETRRLLAEGMAERSAEELGRLLPYADQRVRMAAQFELARRGEADVLLAAARQTDGRLARLHGLWGLGQIARQAPTSAVPEALPAFLEADDPEVRAQAAKVLGDVYAALELTEEGTAAEVGRPEVGRLIAQLEDENARARLYAAEALGKLEARSAFDGLVALLEEIGEGDPHLRHAATLALARIGDADALAALTDHPSTDVRVGAVVALRRMRSPDVAAFLDDADERVVTEAARAIHDDESIPDALPALAAALETTPFVNEPLLRRAVNANRRLGGEEQARRLAAFAGRTDAPDELRADALAALGVWAEPLALDRVDGRHRGLEGHDAAVAIAALRPEVEGLLAQTSAPVRAAAAQAAGRLGDGEAEPALFRMATDSGEAPDVRRAALRALGALDSPRVTEAVQLALADAGEDVRREAQRLMGRLDLSKAAVAAMLETILENGSIGERQEALATLGALENEEASVLLSRQLDALLSDAAEDEVRLDLLAAAERSTSEQVRAKLAEYEAARDPDDPLGAYREALYGGDPEAGAGIVYEHASAQCIRCHQVQKQGGLVGPDLSRIGTELSREQLLEALVLPSARLAPGYGATSVRLGSGQTLAGTLMAETDSTLTLSTSRGTDTIRKADVAERTDAPSAMPSMQGLLTKREIRDVVAFLATLDGQGSVAQASGE